jgi:hypothetical protein
MKNSKLSVVAALAAGLGTCGRRFGFPDVRR